MTEGGDHGTSLYGNFISISDVLEICSEHWCQTIRALELRRTENPSKAGISDLRCFLQSLNLANIVLRVHCARGRPIVAATYSSPCPPTIGLIHRNTCQSTIWHETTITILLSPDTSEVAKGFCEIIHAMQLGKSSRRSETGLRSGQR